jgi:hypothetical protein
MIRKFTTLAIGLIAFTVLAVLAGHWTANSINAVRAYKTITFMGQIANILKIEKPTRVDHPDLLTLLTKYNRGNYIRDGWGHDFEIQVQFDAVGLFHYSIRSFGRDGKQGPCCSGSIGNDWDGDAMLTDDRWLQIWHP